MKSLFVIIALLGLTVSSPARDADSDFPTLAEACLLETPSEHPKGCIEGNEDEEQVGALKEIHESVEPLVGRYAGMVKGIEEAFENLDQQYGGDTR